MKAPGRIVGAFFSPTGTTARVVSRLTERLGQLFALPVVTLDFTLPEGRLVPLQFGAVEISRAIVGEGGCWCAGGAFRQSGL